MNFLFVDQSTENIGVQILTAILKQEGHSVDLALRLMPYSDKRQGACYSNSIVQRFVEQILDKKPDMVGFSAFTDSYAFLAEVADGVRNKSDVPIVFGGIHPTLTGGKIIHNDFIDYIIVGEGESALPKLISAIEGIIPFKDVPNLIYKDNGVRHNNPQMPYCHNLDTLPFPDKSLYAKLNPYITKAYCTIASRGCHFNCSYCSNNVYHRIYHFEKEHIRKRSPENVIAELEIAKKKYPVSTFYLVDDMFAADYEWLVQFTELYVERIGVPFHCASHPSVINDNIAELLSRAGCFNVEIGLQTPVERLRRSVLKRYEPVDMIRKATVSLKKHHVPFSLDHIFGLPGENVEDEQETLEFHNSVNTRRIDKYWLNFYPGTDIVDIAIENNVITEQEKELIQRGLFSFDYMTCGYLSLYPERLKRTYRIACYMELLFLFPHKINSFIIRNKLYLLLPGNAYMYRILRLLTMQMRGNSRMLDLIGMVIRSWRES